MRLSRRPWALFQTLPRCIAQPARFIFLSARVATVDMAVVKPYRSCMSLFEPSTYIPKKVRWLILRRYRRDHSTSALGRVP
jgi:hypothetical protein